MESIRKLYENLWKSFIRPRRYAYSEHDLGGNFLVFRNSFATRLDFQLTNPLNEHFHLSVYLPSDHMRNVFATSKFVVYTHTHNGSRIEGLHILERVIEKGLGFATFDFRANGLSTGKYVTLGWLEALDLNEVVRFLHKDVKACQIALWGRSMGGSAISFFMSERYREEISEFIDNHYKSNDGKNETQKDCNQDTHGKNLTNINQKETFRIQSNNLKTNTSKLQWADPNLISCIVLDSCFPSLRDSIHNLVCTKIPKAPKFLIDAVFVLIGKEIKAKANVELSKINPIDYVNFISTPLFMYVGDKDELISTEMFQGFYGKFTSQVRRLKIFPGCHAQERPEALIEETLEFILNAKELRRPVNKSYHQSISSTFNEQNSRHNKTMSSVRIYDDHKNQRTPVLKHTSSLTKIDNPKHVSPSFFVFDDICEESRKSNLDQADYSYKIEDQESKLSFNPSFLRTYARNNDLTIRNIKEVSQLNEPQGQNNFSMRVPTKNIFSSRTLISGKESSIANMSMNNQSKIVNQNNRQKYTINISQQGENEIFRKKSDSISGNPSNFQLESLRHQPVPIEAKEELKISFQNQNSNQKTVFVPVYESKWPGFTYATNNLKNQENSTHDIQENIPYYENIIKPNLKLSEQNLNTSPSIKTNDSHIESSRNFDDLMINPKLAPPIIPMDFFKTQDQSISQEVRQTQPRH
jgi:hypothetical protein